MVDQFPLIKRKIRVPQRRPGQIRRQRLLDDIHANIQQKLIMVAAGAGYGKTSLLIDFAHDTDLPVCWYSLDPSDTHLRNFVEYLTAAIRLRFPNFGASILDYWTSHQEPDDDVEPFIRLFISEIEEHTDDYFYVVLDDYHEIIESEPINALVDGILRYLPENCHLILASRGIPRRLTLTRLAARGQVLGMGVEDLAFTADEVASVLRGMGYADLDDQQINRIAQRSQGWITGILLAAQSNWGQDAQNLVALTGASGGVFEFLAEQVLERQPEDVQSFMLESALLDEMTVPLCNALLGHQDSAQRLRDLAARSLFIFPLDAEYNAYQYHQLFREFLLARLEQSRPERYRQLSLAKADLLIHEGRWPQAIDSYLGVQAFDEAARAIEIAAQDAYNSGHLAELDSWIAALPADVLQGHPRLVFYRGKVALDTTRLDEAGPLFDQAAALYAGRQDTLGVARALVQQGVLRRLRGQLDEAIRLCRAALEQAAGRDALVDTQAHHNIGLSLAMAGNYDLAVQELQTALHQANTNGDDTNAAYIANDLATTELNRGRLEAARKSYHQALLPWRRIGNPSGLALVLQGLGVVQHYLGQYVDAEQRFHESLDRANLINDRRIAAYAMASLADLERDKGRLPEAVRWYQQAREMAAAARDPHLLLYVLASQAMAYRNQGERQQAAQVLTEALDQVDTEHMLLETGLCHLAQGLLHYDQQAWPQARSCLEQALGGFVAVQSVRDQGRAQLYLAAVAQRLDDLANVRDHLQRLAECAAALGSQQFIVAEGPGMLPVVRLVEELGIRELNYARIHADMVQLYPQMAQQPIVRLISPVPFEFLGLDGGRVLRNHEPLGGWATEAAQTMAFFLASYPDGVQRDRVIDTLWPEIGLSQTISQFHSTLYRVRQVLGKEAVINRRKSYYINPEWPYRYDVTEFGRLRAMSHEGGQGAHLARVQCLGLYRTPFLGAIEGEWADQTRRALERDLLELLLAEARHQAQQLELEASESLYLRALSLDSLDERAHRGLMWCKSQRNDRAGALRQFRLVSEMLYDELGEQPAPDTQLLHLAIRDNHTALPPL
jgi:ATP/maltotriose-dependent transcriptional regulator MalT/DNA-binding SARP family transcriptional activator